MANGRRASIIPVEVSLNPWEFRIVRTGITEVYEAGPDSSIVYNSSLSRPWRPLHDADKNFHPVKFYDHHPNIGIAYLRDRAQDKIVARALVYQQEQNREFGAVYADDALADGMLRTLLRHRLNICHHTMKWTSDFELPIMKIKEHHVVPIPFFDNLDPVYFLPNLEKMVCYVSSENNGGVYYNGLSHQGFAIIKPGGGMGGSSQPIKPRAKVRRLPRRSIPAPDKGATA